MPDSARAGTAWPAVLAATLCGIVVAMNIGKLPIVLPQLRGEFGLSLTAAGWLAAAFSMLAMVCGMPIGILADRIGAQRFCLFGLAASLCGGLLGLAGASANLLLISRLIEGIGFLSVSVSAPALVTAASAPSQRRITLGIWSTYMPAGASLVTLLAPLLIARGGWHSLWWLVLVLLALSICSVALQRRHYSGATARRHAGMADIRGALHQPVPWLSRWPSPPLLPAVRGAVAIWPLHLPAGTAYVFPCRDRRGAGAGQCRQCTGQPWSALRAGCIIGVAGWIAAASLVMGLAGLGIFSDWLPDPLRYVCCLLLTGVGGVIPVAVLSSSVVLAANPQQIGTLQGLYLQGSNLGQFAGIPLICRYRQQRDGTVSPRRWPSTASVLRQRYRSADRARRIK